MVSVDFFSNSSQQLAVKRFKGSHQKDIGKGKKNSSVELHRGSKSRSAVVSKISGILFFPLASLSHRIAASSHSVH